MHRIGIVGYYNARNFGDDLMAVLFAEIVRKHGHEPVVLSDSSAIEACGVPTCSNATDLFKCTDAVILGGGGVLQEAPSDDVTSLGHQFSRTLLDIAKLAGRYDKPLYAASIGGSSSSPSTVRPLRYGVVAFLASASLKFATTRLQSDLSCLHYLSTEVEYAPDVVLATDYFLANHPRRSISPDTINAFGVQDMPRYYAARLVRMSNRGTLPPLIFFHGTTESRDQYIRQVPESRECEHKVLSLSIVESLNCIQELKGVIASRLHFGVTALSFGVPFFTINASKKVNAFFSDLALNTPTLDVGILSRRRSNLPVNYLVGACYAEQLSQARIAARRHGDVVVRGCHLR